MTTFMRLLEVSVEEKADALRKATIAIQRGELSERSRIFERDPTAFASVPTSPFAYWASEDILKLFTTAEPLHSNGTVVASTNPMNDDFRYVRAWWEPAAHQLVGSWKPWAKGGAHSPIYYDIDTVVQWDSERETYTGFLGTESRQRDRPVASVQHFFRPGLTWPRRTNGLSLRVLAKGSIFADKGPAIFVERDNADELLALASITNSGAFRLLVSLQLARTELAQSFEVGLIQQTPVPRLTETDRQVFARLARRAWSLKRRLDTTNETSHAFVLPPGTIGYEAVPPHEQAGGFSRCVVEQELIEIQREIDECAFALYGIGAEDRLAIESASKRGAISQGNNGAEDEEEAEARDDSDESAIGVPVLPVYSWLVGVAFGRFDKRLATENHKIPSEPEPFDPLPSRSPGMWPEGEPRDVIPPEILVDDPGHDHDLGTRVADAAANTGWPALDDLRQWLAREFFPLHIKMYSKSRRKAPIYWQLATLSASYSVWLYLHAFTKDTLYKVQNDYVAPKVAHEERRLESLRRELGESPKAAERKALTTQETFVDELRAFLEEVKRVAPLWNPNLDDGVIINFAPLWRLVPQHKPWQKELKATWDALCGEEYDWAHLAMHLWPERVVPKCATDRSLAIAHGLEEVFWVEGADGKWAARKAPTRPVEELVRERTSAAVKAALKSLLEAPVATGGSKKARKGKGSA